MFIPYKSNYRNESNYERICMGINGKTCTVPPAKSDTDDMFYLQRNQGRIIDRLLVY